MAQAADLPGAAHLELVDGVVHLDPKPALFDAMLTGWVRQQQTRFLSEEGTIKPRVALVRRLAEFTNAVSLGVDSVGRRGVLHPTPVI